MVDVELTTEENRMPCGGKTNYLFKIKFLTPSMLRRSSITKFLV